MMYPSGVCSSFMVLPSLDVIYQAAFIVAIAMLPTNRVDVLQLSSFQGDRVTKCKRANANFPRERGQSLVSLLPTSLSTLGHGQSTFSSAVWEHLAVICVRRCREEAWRKMVRKGRLKGRELLVEGSPNAGSSPKSFHAFYQLRPLNAT